jgi:hypothetical protein
MSDRLVMVFTTQRFGKWEENIASWGDVPFVLVDGIRPLTKAYQVGFERAIEKHPDCEILGYCHDDVTVFDPTWKQRVLAEFEDPEVGLVGFGGSTGHGNANIYRIPYSMEQVAREGTFMSNMVNAEQHGMRITDSREAKCLDGFAMFVRRSVLEKWGGWPQNECRYWCYDYMISCETRRQGKRIRVVGVSCEHTAPPEYRSYVIDEDCQAAHRWLYENYRDTFPARS